jgi:hypothetical protein
MKASMLLYAWDDTNKEWVKVAITSDGKIKIVSA